MKHIVSILSAVVLSFSSFAFAAEIPANSPSPKVVDSATHQVAVNINTADVSELTKLKGVGLKKAEAIVEWRKANGNFKTVDQLIEVNGIGEATLTANRENIRI